MPPVCRQGRDDAEAVVDLVDQLAAVAEQQPGIVLARCEAERQRSVEDQRRLLADVVAGVGLAAFDGGILDGIENLQTGNDLAGGKGCIMNLLSVISPTNCEMVGATTTWLRRQARLPRT